MFTQLSTLKLDYTLVHNSAMADDVMNDESEDTIENKDHVEDGVNSKSYTENAITFFCREHHEAFPLLSELSLGGITSLSDSDVSLLLSPHPSKKCTSSSSDPMLLAIGERLQSLNLRECTLLTDDTLISIRTHCRNLRTLDISYIPHFTTPALLGLFIQEKYIAPMESLSSISPIQNSGIHNPNALNRSIGPLCQLYMKGLSKSVTDDVVIEACVLSSSAGNGLKDLNISGCRKVTDKSLVAISRHCSHTLEHVDVSFLHSLSLAVFLHFLHQFTISGKLQTVTIWGCSQLRRAVIDAMANSEVEMISSDPDDTGIESVSASELLRQVKKNTHEPVTQNDIVEKMPTIVGFLNI
jgi:hypothetical protein